MRGCVHEPWRMCVARGQLTELGSLLPPGEGLVEGAASYLSHLTGHLRSIKNYLHVLILQRLHYDTLTLG